jgi:hypothetical protein
VEWIVGGVTVVVVVDTVLPASGGAPASFVVPDWVMLGSVASPVFRAGAHMTTLQEEFGNRSVISTAGLR